MWDVAGACLTDVVICGDRARRALKVGNNAVIIRVPSHVILLRNGCHVPAAASPSCVSSHTALYDSYRKNLLDSRGMLRGRACRSDQARSALQG